MRTDSIIFPPFDVFQELQLSDVRSKDMQHERDVQEPARSVPDDPFNRFADSASILKADPRLDSFQDLLATLMALPEGFQDRLLARGLEERGAEGTQLDASPGTGAGAETPHLEQEPLFEAAGGDRPPSSSKNAEGETSDELTYTVLGDVNAPVDVITDSNGLLGLAYSSGINEEGTEIVTVVLGEEDGKGLLQWNSDFSTINTGDIEGRIPTTALELVVPESDALDGLQEGPVLKSGVTAGYSPTRSARRECESDDGVFAPPSRTPGELNTALQFPRTRFGLRPQPDLGGNSSPSSASAPSASATTLLTPSPSYCSLSSGYSSMSSISTCLTTRSASTSSADCEDSSSAFSEGALLDEDTQEEFSLAPLSEDDALALQRLNITPLVKENLKRAICKRRHDSGLPLPDVDNAPKAKVKKEMTAEERARYIKRREQNRNAATRFRQKQKDTADILTQKCRKLENSNTTLRTEIARLAQETAHLKQMLQAHLHVCPTMSAMICR